MTIKHLILPGGGPNLLYVYGILKKLYFEKFWTINNIETIHGTSAGAILGIVLLLDLDWVHLDEYIIKRPWKNVFSFKPQQILNAYEKRGLLDINNLKQICLPLFNSKDISIDITFKELFEKTNKKFYVYVTELNSFESKVFSVDKSPDLKVIDAVYMSSSIPPLFQPVIDNENCYLDGGIFTNYPIKQCLECDETINLDDILCIKFLLNKTKTNTINEDSKLNEYLFCIIRKLISKMQTFEKTDYKLKNTVYVNSNGLDMDTWSNILYDSEIREKIINDGCNYAEIFLNYKN